MKYLIDEKECEELDFRSTLEEDIRDELDYDDFLDECYDEIKIGYCTFTASEILKNCDPIAYNCGLDDVVSGQLDDAMYELENENEYKTSEHSYKIIV